MSDRRPRFRCSGLDRNFLCHGARLLAQAPGLDQDEDNASDPTMAAVGTWGHYLVARWAMRRFGAFAPEEGLPTPTGRPENWSAFDRWAVKFCCEQLAAFVDADMAVECEVSLSAAFPRFDLDGHVDILAINAAGTHAKAWDWKLGHNVVRPADANNQVLGYLVLLFLVFGDLQEIEFFLVQPHANVGEGHERVTSLTVTRDQLPSLVKWLNKKINQVLDDPYRLNTGRRQCRYCPAIGLPCPAIEAHRKAMEYVIEPNELARLTSEEEDVDTLFEIDRNMIVMASAAEAVRKRLKHIVYKHGKRVKLRDGREVYLKRRNGRRYFTRRGFELLNRLSSTPEVGRQVAESFYFASPKMVQEHLSKTLMDPEKPGKKMQKSSKVPGKVTVATEMDRMFGDIVLQNSSEVLAVDGEPEEGGEES